jgi:hypothetical protein
MNINRGGARPGPASAAGRSNVASSSAADAGLARGSGLFGPLARAQAPVFPPKDDDKDDKDMDSKDSKVAKAKDDGTSIDIPKDKDKNKPDSGLSNDDDTTAKSAWKPMTTKAAGDGGDFKPMGGNAKDPWDANADKGNTSAKNDTGAPNTPSGF